MLKSGPRTDQNCFPREMQLLWKQQLLHSTPRLNRTPRSDPRLRFYDTG
jgi:hypothetical protein